MRISRYGTSTALYNRLVSHKVQVAGTLWLKVVSICFASLFMLSRLSHLITAVIYRTSVRSALTKDVGSDLLFAILMQPVVFLAAWLGLKICK